jgi:ABC-type amino acid transport system permease subunit
MSADTIFEHREPIRKPGWRKALPWVIVVLVVGIVIAVVAVKYSNTGKSQATPLLNKPAQDVSKVPPTVKLPPGATKVARQFIETAVARKNLGQSYSIVTDQIKQGQSLKSWMTGNIAVVPFPVVDVKYAPMKIDFSYPAEAQIEVALLPKAGAKVHGQLFIMDIVKRDGKWLVNSWVPRASAPVPNGSGNNGAGN